MMRRPSPRSRRGSSGSPGKVPTISSLDVTSATQYDDATTVVVTGTNFRSGTVFKFGGVVVPSTFNSATQATCIIPAPTTSTSVLATSGVKAVTASNYGKVSASTNFTVNAWSIASDLSATMRWRTDTLSDFTVTGGVSPPTGDALCEAWRNSANTRTATASGTNRPNFLMSEFNGTPAVKFTGATKQLTNTANISELGWSVSTKWGMAVIRVDTAPTGSEYHPIFMDSTIRFGLYTQATAGTWDGKINLYSSTGSVSSNAKVAVSVGVTYVVIFKLASGNLSITTNLNTATGENVVTSVGNTQFNTGSWQMGIDAVNTGYGKCTIGEQAYMGTAPSGINERRAIRAMGIRAGVTL